MSRRSFCRGTCQKYAVDERAGMRRYGEGQARCRMCDVWLDAKGALLEGGAIATAGTVGWHCRCCRCKLRARMRNVRYTSRSGPTGRVGTDVGNRGTSNVDLSYFSRVRADLLQRLAAVLPERREDIAGSGDDYFPTEMIYNLREEFGDTNELLDLAYDIDPPNKISMLVEFERIKWNLDRVPTKDEFERISPLSVGAYESEFGSWENFLDKLGHDPWYRHANALTGDGVQHKQSTMPTDGRDDTTDSTYDDNSDYDNVAMLREKMRDILEYDQDALKIFEMLESDIDDVNPTVLRQLADEVASD